MNVVSIEQIDSVCNSYLCASCPGLEGRRPKETYLLAG